jgi:hypothetical protein
MRLFQGDLLNKILLLLQIFVAQQTLIEKYIKQKNFFQLFIEFEILLERKTFLFYDYFTLIYFISPPKEINHNFKRN